MCYIKYIYERSKARARANARARAIACPSFAEQHSQAMRKKAILIRSGNAVHTNESEGDGNEETKTETERHCQVRQRQKTYREEEKNHTEYIEYKPKTHDAWGKQQQ